MCLMYCSFPYVLMVTCTHHAYMCIYPVHCHIHHRDACTSTISYCATTTPSPNTYHPIHSPCPYIHDKYMLPIVMYDRTHSLAHVARAASRADSKHVFDSVLLVSTYTDGYLYASCIHAYTLHYHISRSMTCIYHY